MKINYLFLPNKVGFLFGQLPQRIMSLQEH